MSLLLKCTAFWQLSSKLKLPLVEFLRYRVVLALQNVFLDVMLNEKSKSKQLLKLPPPFEGKELSQLPGMQLEPLNVQHS